MNCVNNSMGEGSKCWNELYVLCDIEVQNVYSYLVLVSSNVSLLILDPTKTQTIAQSPLQEGLVLALKDRPFLKMP